MNKTEFVKAYNSYCKANKARSAWDKGVRLYCEDLIENLCEDEDYNARMFTRALLNGASDWSEYSWGGCSLIYDKDIAKRLCTNTELKRTDYGHRDPNKNEQWLDVQTRALYQAYLLLHEAFDEAE